MAVNGVEIANIPLGMLERSGKELDNRVDILHVTNGTHFECLCINYYFQKKIIQIMVFFA